MGKTYKSPSTLPFTASYDFATDAPMDLRSVVDSVGDLILDDTWKPKKSDGSYLSQDTWTYGGMLVVTQDTGSVYTLVVPTGAAGKVHGHTYFRYMLGLKVRQYYKIKTNCTIWLDGDFEEGKPNYAWHDRSDIDDDGSAFINVTEGTLFPKYICDNLINEIEVGLSTLDYNAFISTYCTEGFGTLAEVPNAPGEHDEWWQDSTVDCPYGWKLVGSDISSAAVTELQTRVNKAIDSNGIINLASIKKSALFSNGYIDSLYIAGSTTILREVKVKSVGTDGIPTAFYYYNNANAVTDGKATEATTGNILIDANDNVIYIVKEEYVSGANKITLNTLYRYSGSSYYLHSAGDMATLINKIKNQLTWKELYYFELSALSDLAFALSSDFVTGTYDLYSECDSSSYFLFKKNNSIIIPTFSNILQITLKARIGSTAGNYFSSNSEGTIEETTFKVDTDGSLYTGEGDTKSSKFFLEVVVQTDSTKPITAKLVVKDTNKYALVLAINLESNDSVNNIQPMYVAVKDVTFTYNGITATVQNNDI